MSTIEASENTPPAPHRSAVWCGAIGAFLLVYLLVYPLVPIALQQSGVGQSLPDWLETAFDISAAPLILAHETVPVYRGYVKFLGGVMEAR